MALSRKTGNAFLIAAVDERAERLGLKAGTGVADACARFPAVEIVEENGQAGQRLLEALADWCDRYTPLVGLDGADGLFLDISGCAHLFGGETPLLADCLARLGRQGFSARAGLASTPGTAWALARFAAHPCAPVPPGGEREALARMPLGALRLEAAAREGLEKVGLRRVGDVLATPRAPLARRFGAHLLRRIDQALGTEEEAIGPRCIPGLVSAERHLAEPVVDAELVEEIAARLAQTIAPDLERHNQGARRLELALFRVDGLVKRLELGLSRASRDPGRILRERFQALEGRLDAGFGFDLVRLSVRETAPFGAEQSDWLGEPGRDEEELGTFADRVSARLGPETLVQAVAVASHVPERAALWLSPVRAARSAPPSPSGPGATWRSPSPPWGKGLGETWQEEEDRQAGRGGTAVAGGHGPRPCHKGRSPDAAPLRPLRLLAPPERVEVTAEVPEGPPIQFGWRRVLYRVASAEGPERIAPEWWRGSLGPIALECENGAAGGESAATRDYFRVEDHDGRRFWLFREGLYGSGSEPRWFLHGFFA